MNFHYYSACFHDGEVNAIHHGSERLTFDLASSEIAPEENIDNLTLSDQNRLRGHLSLSKILVITENDTICDQELRMQLDDGELYRLSVDRDTATLGIRWCCYGADARSREQGNIVISKLQGKTRVYLFNPRYPFLKELKQFLGKAYTFLPDEIRSQYEPLETRTRPRKRGKPL